MAKSMDIRSPQDIIDIVIEAVGDDTHLLKQCTLVSSSFLLPAHKQLFSSTTLKSDQTCQGINQLLVQNPFIQPFIRPIILNGITGSWGPEYQWMNGTRPILRMLKF